MKCVIFIALLIPMKNIFAQDSTSNYLSKNNQVLEFKLGLGKLQPQLVAFDFNYQRNILKHISTLAFSQIDVSAWDRNAKKNALVINHLHFLQTVGIGSTIGRKRFNTGLFLLGGGRIYHTHTIVEGLHSPNLYTTKFLPELGLLLNLKIGKRKYYFSTQLYFPLTPFGNSIIEKNPTLTFGVGYKLTSKK